MSKLVFKNSQINMKVYVRDKKNMFIEYFLESLYNYYINIDMFATCFEFDNKH